MRVLRAIGVYVIGAGTAGELYFAGWTDESGE